MIIVLAVYAAETACPSGWHLPTASEWTVFKEYLINNEYCYEGTGIDIGKSMASTSGWNTSDPPETLGNDQQSNNCCGFNILPVG